MASYASVSLSDNQDEHNTPTCITQPTDQKAGINPIDDERERYDITYVNALRKGVSSLCHNSALSDVDIVVDGHHFKCHRVILNIFSGFFKSMFTSGMKECEANEIDLKSISANIFGAILNFIYSGEITNINLEELLTTSLYLQIQSLSEICQKKLIGQLDRDRILNFWRVSKIYVVECELLRLACEKWILVNIISYSKSEDFLNMNADEIEFLVSHDSLFASTEDDVCKLIVKWFQNDIESRKQHLVKVFQHVRFPLMTKAFLKYIKTSFPLINHDSLIPHLEEAEKYHNNPSRKCDVNTPQTEPRRNSSFEKGIIIISGCKGEINIYFKKVWFYSFQTNTWGKLAPLPHTIGFGFATCTFGQSYVYISGGHGTSECYRYHLTGDHNKWKKCISMEEERVGHSLITVNRSIYAIGGMQDDYSEFLGRKVLSSIETYKLRSYNPWDICGELQIGVCDAAVGNAIYIFGGDPTVSSPYPVQSFNVCTEESCIVQNLPYVTKVLSVGCDEDIYIMNTNRNESDGIYSFRSNKLERIARIPPKVIQKDYEITKYGQRLYMLGGEGPLSDNISEYNLETQEFRTLEQKLPYTLYDFGCHVVTVKKQFIFKS